MRILAAALCWIGIAAGAKDSHHRKHQTAWSRHVERLALENRLDDLDVALLRGPPHSTHTYVHFIAYYPDGGSPIHTCAYESLLRALARPDARPAQASFPSGDVAVLVWVQRYSLAMEVYGPLVSQLDALALSAGGRRQIHVCYLQATFPSMIQNTLLASFFATSYNHSSSLARQDVGDAARLSLVFKYTGFYADLDFIFIRDPTPLPDFVAGQSHAITWRGLNNAIFKFTRPKHALLDRLMKDFGPGYKDDWGTQGPALFRRVLQRPCRLQYPICRDIVFMSALESSGFSAPDVFRGYAVASPPPSRTLRSWEHADKENRSIAVHSYSKATAAVEKQACRAGRKHYVSTMLGRTRAAFCPTTMAPILPPVDAAAGGWHPRMCRW